jgi:hypothetical protein
MQQVQLKVLGTGQRVEGFIDNNGVVIGPLPPEFRAKLDAATKQMIAGQLEQSAADSAAKGAVSTQAAIRKSMNDDLLRPIARVAMSDLSDTPEFSALFVPAGSMAKAVLVSKLNQVADAAVLHEKAFLNRGLAADFITKLRTASAQFAATADLQDRSIARRSAATASIADAEKVIRNEVSVMNKVLSSRLKSNPALLADWNNSKRIQPTTVNPMATGSVTPVDDTSTSAAQPAPATPAAP